MEGPIRKRLRCFSKARNVGRIDQTRSREPNNRMHRCRPPLPFYSRARIYKSRLRKQLTLFPSCSPEGYRPPRDISPLCLIIRRQPDGESPASAPPPLHPFRAFSSAYFLPRRGCRSCHKFRQPWRVSYFEYEMNYVPLLPDMAYGMEAGGEGLFFFERSSFFFFFLICGGRGVVGRFFKENWRPEAGRRRR